MIGVFAEPEQIVCERVFADAVGDGLTPIKKFFGLLLQAGTVLLTAVTVMVAVARLLPVLMPVKEAILPVPLAANPIEVLLLVQLYTAPGTELLKFTGIVLKLLQVLWSGILASTGVGFTVISNETGVPLQAVPGVQVLAS